MTCPKKTTQIRKAIRTLICAILITNRIANPRFFYRIARLLDFRLCRIQYFIEYDISMLWSSPWVKGRIWTDDGHDMKTRSSNCPPGLSIVFFTLNWEPCTICNGKSACIPGIQKSTVETEIEPAAVCSPAIVSELRKYKSSCTKH